MNSWPRNRLAQQWRDKLALMGIDGKFLKELLPISTSEAQGQFLDSLPLSPELKKQLREAFNEAQEQFLDNLLPPLLADTKTIGFPNTRVDAMDEAILLLYDTLERAKREQKKYYVIATHVPPKGDETTLQFWQTLKAKTYLDLHYLLTHTMNPCEIHRIFVFERPEHLLNISLGGFQVLFEQLKLGISCYYTFRKWLPRERQADVTDMLIVTPEDGVFFDYVFVDQYDAGFPYLSKFFVGRDLEANHAEERVKPWLLWLFYEEGVATDTTHLPFCKKCRTDYMVELVGRGESKLDNVPCTFDKEGFRVWRDKQKDIIEQKLQVRSQNERIEWYREKTESLAGHPYYEEAEALLRNAKQFIHAVDTTSVKNYLEIHGTDPLYRNWLRACLERMTSDEYTIAATRTYVVDDERDLGTLAKLLADYYVHSKKDLPPLKKLGAISRETRWGGPWDPGITELSQRIYDELLTIEGLGNIRVYVADLALITKFFEKKNEEKALRMLQFFLDSFRVQHPDPTIHSLTDLEHVVRKYFRHQDDLFRREYLDRLKEEGVDPDHSLYEHEGELFLELLKQFVKKDFLITESMIYDYLNVTAKLSQPVVPAILIKDGGDTGYKEFLQAFTFVLHLLHNYFAMCLTEDGRPSRFINGVSKPLDALREHAGSRRMYRYLGEQIGLKQGVSEDSAGTRVPERIVFHVSDLHFGRYRVFRNGPEKFRTFLRTFTQKKGRPVDFLVISGDLTSMSEREDYSAFAHWIGQLSDDVRTVIAVPGNHDNVWRDVSSTPSIDHHAMFKGEMENLPQVITPFSVRGSRGVVDTIEEPSEGQAASLVVDEKGKVGFLTLCSSAKCGEVGGELQQLLIKEKMNRENPTGSPALKEIIRQRARQEHGRISWEYANQICRMHSNHRNRLEGYAVFVVVHDPVISTSACEAALGADTLIHRLGTSITYLCGHTHDWAGLAELETNGMPMIPVGTLFGPGPEACGFNVIETRSGKITRIYRYKYADNQWNPENGQDILKHLWCH